ncbi:MAG: ParB/RepB/Spo0J family partition protein [Lachnospiraceae bacterium]|nr:ParB/RepB/Spo0J family partition protein [Lachnospiraceae bacterium]
MASKNRGLGKGLDALIPTAANESKNRQGKDEAASGSANSSGEGVSYVKITMVEPDRNQPRKAFDEDKLEELAESIKQHGVITPLVVQDRKDHYQIIAGERRWRASKMAGIKEIPVVIKNYTEEEIAEISLIENIQREDLNPIEEALAYKRLIEEFNLKQDEVAERVSKSRTTVTNSLRLLKLCDEVQKMVIDDMIDTGHVRPLITVEDPKEQYELAQRIFDEKLSVREVEKLVKDLHKPKKSKKNKDVTIEAIYADIEEKLKQKLGTKVSITGRDGGAGKLEIEFYNHDDLDRIFLLLNNKE